MRCLKCDIEMVLVERKGVDIDYCPTCGGVWLDKGELDLLMERTEPDARNVPVRFKSASMSGRASQLTSLFDWF